MITFEAQTFSKIISLYPISTVQVKFHEFVYQVLLGEPWYGSITGYGPWLTE